MTLQRRELLAALLGTGLVLLLLVIAALGGARGAQQPEEILVRREVQMYVPPAPPPPPQVQVRAGGGGGRPLAMVSVASAVKLEFMELDVSAPVTDLGMAGLGSGGLGSGPGGIGSGGIGDGMLADLGTVDLSALDGYPTVVSAPVFRFPDFLQRRREKEFTVQFHIVIDEEGYTYPVRIVANPYPQLNRDLLNYASKVRFTPPTRQGIRVKTEYLWPVVLSEPD